MLVLSRKEPETVTIVGSDGIERIVILTLLEIYGGTVKLGLDVRKVVPNRRWEFPERISKKGIRGQIFLDSRQDKVNGTTGDNGNPC